MTTRFSAEEVFTAATRYAFSLLALLIGCYIARFVPKQLGEGGKRTKARF
jgi:hypothetical protein